MAGDLLAAEANHRIANNLALISGILRLQANEIAKTDRPMSPREVGGLLSEVSLRIEAVGCLHRLLAGTDGDDHLDIGDYLYGVASASIHSMSGPRIDLGPPPSLACRIPAKIALSIGFIVGEAVTNAVKYAHPSGVAGHVDLTCERVGGNSTLIRIADDGVGLPEGFDPSVDGGLGLRMMRIIAHQLGADLVFENEGVGLTISLLLPPERLAAAG